MRVLCLHCFQKELFVLHSSPSGLTMLFERSINCNEQFLSCGGLYGWCSFEIQDYSNYQIPIGITSSSFLFFAPTFVCSFRHTYRCYYSYVSVNTHTLRHTKQYFLVWLVFFCACTIYESSDSHRNCLTQIVAFYLLTLRLTCGYFSNAKQF